MTAIDYKADQKTVQEILNLYEKDHLNLVATARRLVLRMAGILK
jgi:hypothetical protein